MKMTMVFAVVLILVWQCGLSPQALAAEPTSQALAEGKALFEEKCSRCHEIESPLSRDMERAEWEKLLIEMTARGAEMKDGEKTLILDYLGARYIFTSKCTGCHTKERIFDRERSFKEWVSTVQIMAAKSPDLISAEEAAAIVSYLTLVLGPQK